MQADEGNKELTNVLVKVLVILNRNYMVTV